MTPSSRPRGAVEAMPDDQGATRLERLTPARFRALAPHSQAIYILQGLWDEPAGEMRACYWNGCADRMLAQNWQRVPALDLSLLGRSLHLKPRLPYVRPYYRLSWNSFARSVAGQVAPVVWQWRPQLRARAGILARPERPEVPLPAAYSSHLREAILSGVVLPRSRAACDAYTLRLWTALGARPESSIVREPGGYELRCQDGSEPDDEIRAAVAAAFAEIAVVLPGIRLDSLCWARQLRLVYTRGRAPLPNTWSAGKRAMGLHLPKINTLVFGAQGWPRPTQTLAHEFGHWLGGLSPWLPYEAAESLDAAARMRLRGFGQAMRAYVTEPDEVWARLFEQWVAWRVGGSKLWSAMGFYTYRWWSGYWPTAPWRKMAGGLETILQSTCRFLATLR